MNGRVYRSPVLAWNVDPFPAEHMPAAAISPAWNNVDAAAGTGTSFPYFGALYNNSLPPTAYRLQPGCMPALGQFWPPTPPPDGCGRFDGSNLYFGPPVLRHTENISSNIRSSFQGLGHYSHLVETSKEQNQRLFKRETPISPSVSVPNIAVCSSVSKNDNFNNCCAVDGKNKSLSSVAYSLPKQELHTISSGHEPYLCSSDIRSSSIHPSTDKSHFSSSPHSLKNTLNFHSQDTRAKAMIGGSGNQENCNASPLKNVYFSHYESENVNSSIHSTERSFHYDGKSGSPLLSSRSKPLHMQQQQQSLNNSYLQNHQSSKKYGFQSSQDREHLMHSTPPIRSDSLTVIKEKYKQKPPGAYKVKPEKSQSDCKYQKQQQQQQQRPPATHNIQEYKNSEMFNIPTSVLQHAKVEPKEKYFMPSCSSTAPSCMATSYATSQGPFFVSKDHLSSTGYHQNGLYQNSCSMGKPWHYSDMPAALSLDGYFRTPEPARPPSQNRNPPHVSAGIREDLISVAQTAPQEVGLSRLAYGMQHQHPVRRRAPDVDDDVQIIGVQNKHSPAKHDSRHSSDRKPNCAPTSEPLYFKSEIEDVYSKPNLPFVLENQTSLESSHYKAPVLQMEENIRPPSIEKRTINNEHSNYLNSNFSENLKNSHPCKSATIKQELLKENHLPATNCVDKQPELVSELPQKPPVLVSELSPRQPELVCEIPHKESHVSSAESPKTLPALVCEVPELVSELSPKQQLPELVSELSQEKPAIVYSEKPSLDSIVDSKDILSKSLNKDNIVVKSDILNLDQETEYNENHGLNLLLNTIEKVTSFQKVNCPNPASASSDPLPQLQKQENPSNKKPVVRGLDLLSAIAGQRLVSEFDFVKTESSQEYIKCNYPEIKKTKILQEDQSKVAEDSTNSAKSSVSEIQNILVELKKKYKQKQKELSRLKPKHRFASSYLKGRQKTIKKEFDQNTVSASEGATTDELNSSFSSVCSEGNQHAAPSRSKSKLTCNNESSESKSKHISRMSPVKKEPTPETKNSTKRITRRSLGKSKPGDKILEISKCSKTIKRNSRSKFCKLRKGPNSSAKDIPHASDESASKATDSGKEVANKSDSLPKNKKRKVYSLRQSSQNRKSANSLAESSVIHPKAISSKRKSDNPKKFIPSKQSKLSETINAKHLRNRILFDASGFTSDEENLKDGVPDDLYVAFEECHLDEESKNASKPVKSSSAPRQSNEGSLAYPEPSRLCPEHLVEKQRLLALEEGLFYAGYIKECQTSKKYGISLDGQRGNRLHMFTREELLTQTIVESKPLASDLPEGTRVCAYWSQQYRCLYPGVVGKAPCPSVDWSEPRVFVLFDDGDSGQIPAKNVRLIPPDIIPAENICRSDSSSPSSSNTNSKSRSTSRGQMQRRVKSVSNKLNDSIPEPESKESSCTSINDSSCDDTCSLHSSPSQPSSPTHHDKKRKRSKGSDRCVAESKTKRHKKYKEKHRRHHHHHHRHHHHHHHHHHSKKKKHRRKGARPPSAVVPQDGVTKSEVGHSRCENLPQDAV